MKVVYSLLTERDKIFVPVPGDQQITEQSLIELEKLIITSGMKNDSVLALSEAMAERFTLE